MTRAAQLAGLPTLGVGINYSASGLELMLDRQLVDFIELSPDTLCEMRFDERRGSTLALDPRRLAPCLELRRSAPLVIHGLGLSIGSASGMSESYLQMLGSLQTQLDFPWHSEHIGFMELFSDELGHMHAGTQLPVPFTHEVIQMLTERVAQIQRQFGRPFLLENTTHYLSGLPSDDGLDEIEFLNRLCRASGCGLILDLYNLHCNAINFGFSAGEALSRLDFEYVVELHVAGGVSHKDILMDVHCQSVPEPVWELTQYALQRGANIKAVTFELLEQAYQPLGPDAIRQQLQRARSCWQQSRSARRRVA